MSFANRYKTSDRTTGAIYEFSFSPKSYCDPHASNYKESEESDAFEDTVLPLSSHQTSILRQAADHYRKMSIQQAILKRNKKIENLSRQIKYAEEDCSREIKRILKELFTIQEVCVFRGVPLITDNPLLSSLASLRASSSFSYEGILDTLLSLPSSLLSLSSSLQSSSLPQWKFLQQFQAHEEPITSLAVSDCEKYLASGSEDNTIKTWSLESLECLYTLTGHTKWVKSVAFWGNTLISGSLDKTIKIWEGGRCLDTLFLHSGRVKSVSVSSSKRLLASGGGDNKVFIYSLEERKTIHSLLSHLDSVNSVVFSPSDRQIVSASRDASIKVWDTDTGELLRTLNGHSSTVISVCFAGNFLVSSSCDKSLKIWDLEKVEKEEAVRTLNGHSYYVVKVEGNENILISLGMDNSLRIWNRRSGEYIQTLEGHGDYSQDSCWYAMGLKIIRGGDYILTAGRDKNIKIFKRIS